MKNSFKTLLLMTTMLTSGFVFGQKTQNQKAETKDKFKVTTGVLNTRSPDNFDNLIQRAFIKPSYQITDKISVSAEIGTSKFIELDKKVNSIAFAFGYEGKRTKLNFGYSDVNNELFAKGAYKANDKGLSFVAHAQNLTKKLPETDFLPSIPDEISVAFLAMAEQKTKLYEKNNFKVDMTAGLGISTAPDQDTRLAYKAMFSANFGDIVFSGGVQPLHPVGFQPKATFLLKYNF